MSSELPRFSVVVPTYDRPAQLAACLAALARLDYARERFEVLIVDDGSARSPRDVVERFDGALDVRLLGQENRGPAAARNLGARRARGEFLAFTDDDCEPEPAWLRAFAKRFAEEPARVVGGRTTNALGANPYSETSQLIIEVVYEHFNRDSSEARFFASNNFAVHAESFRAVGGFDEAFRTSEDREFCARWRSRGLTLAYDRATRTASRSARYGANTSATGAARCASTARARRRATVPSNQTRTSTQSSSARRSRARLSGRPRS